MAPWNFCDFFVALIPFVHLEIHVFGTLPEIPMTFLLYTLAFPLISLIGGYRFFFSGKAQEKKNR